MTTFTRAEDAVCLLKNVLIILESQHENNWSRGIKAAIGELEDTGGGVVRAGFDRARSIYNTMTAGARGFSDYFVWVEEEEARLKVNEELDTLRSKLWQTFNS